MRNTTIKFIAVSAAGLAMAGAAIAADAPAAPGGANGAAGRGGAPAAARAPSSDGISSLGSCSSGQAGAGRGGAAGGAAPGGAGGAGRAGAAQGAAAPATPRPDPAPIRSTPQLCLEARSETGFVDIFNGRDLSGWQGEAGRWSVRDGVLTGETTAANPLSINTFLIWTGGTVENFDLKFEWRLTPDGNSGVQYRSERLNIPALGQYVLRGPQYDMGGGPTEPYTANLFEERGVTFLATRGSFSWDTGDKRETIGYVGGSLAAPAGNPATRNLLKTGDWNRGEIIARGDTVIHLVNDQVIGITIDQYANRLKSGAIGIQLHTGPVMKIEFRSIKLKQLPAS